MPNIGGILSNTYRKAVCKNGARLRIVPNFRWESDFYDIKLGKNVIGNTTFSVCRGEDFSQSTLKQFPVSWFTDEVGTKLKPFLNINYIELLKEKGKGFGRKAMQLLYKLSMDKGCEGRMALVSMSQPAGYYSHLGYDCPEAQKKIFDAIYLRCKDIATKQGLSRKDFLSLLRKSGCPSQVNGKYSIDGLRFFIPSAENCGFLFKK